MAVAVERWVADDDARLRPGHAKGVAGLDAAEILQRQGALDEVEFVDGELVRHPERDAGERDRERLELDAPDVVEREEGAQCSLVLCAESGLLTQVSLAVVEVLL